MELRNNYFNFEHEAVDKNFTGGLTFINTVPIEGIAWAVYSVAEPDTSKGHKEYLLLTLKPDGGGVVNGKDAQQMQNHWEVSGIRCLECQDIVFSVARYDFVYCKCGANAIDACGERFIGSSFESVRVNLKEACLV